MDDHTLRAAFSALRGGDREAFQTIYETLSTPVYTVLLRTVGNAAAAEDLLQETFLRLYQAPPGREVANPRSWVFKVARNLALDHLRALRSAAPLEELELSAPQDRPEERLDLADALERLSAEERFLITAHLNAGLKFRELAGLLHLPLGTALRRYYAALDRLRSFLTT